WTTLERVSQEGFELAREYGDLQGMAWHLYQMGHAALGRGNYQQARRLGEESRKNAEARGRITLISAIYGTLLGNAAVRLGAYEEAERLYQRAIELSKVVPTPHQEAYARKFLGKHLLLRGEVEQARQHIQTSIKILQDYGLSFEVV